MVGSSLQYIYFSIIEVAYSGQCLLKSLSDIGKMLIIFLDC